MSNLSLFLLGLAISIPAAVCTIGLVVAAIRDGRENERLRGERVDDEQAIPASRPLTPVGGNR